MQFETTIPVSEVNAPLHGKYIRITRPSKGPAVPLFIAQDDVIFRDDRLIIVDASFSEGHRDGLQPRTGLTLVCVGRLNAEAQAYACIVRVATQECHV